MVLSHGVVGEDAGAGAEVERGQQHERVVLGSEEENGIDIQTTLQHLLAHYIKNIKQSKAETKLTKPAQPSADLDPVSVKSEMRKLRRMKYSIMG